MHFYSFLFICIEYINKYSIYVYLSIHILKLYIIYISIYNFLDMRLKIVTNT